MVFSSSVFLFGFLPAVLAVYYLSPRRARNFVLLFFSLFFFYAWDMPKYALLMVATTAFGYATGLAIGALRKNNKEKYTKAVLVASVIVNLGALGFFKYTDFLIGTVNGIFGTAVPLLGLALPIGISFYTFQTMSYTIDVYRNDCKVQRSFVDFAAYVTMFPQLIAGPIVRYETVEKQLDFRRESFESFGYGAQRFVLGLAKKVLLANSVGALYSELAAYEDTGLTPEEIDMDHEAAEQLRHLCRDCDLDRLEELVKADKEGRTVVLPCKVGGTLWVTGRDNVPREMELEAPDIRTVCTDEDNLCMATCNRKPDGFCAYRLRNDGADIGKTVFLTREEAEKALREME